ncbi:M15 family peptidase [Egibacter rhizosphaerae]|uniref:M15 family peptidase n=1 Tax=Egibacter rhizosphaerae TaxID=1670831 RepID=A0A411YH31_9ACTN|nr:M15 family metallopeptidase [Egibacter rhizosphaerae]QBI20568.1 M15 family peptidase [Egibacter rhizosphaerae]
MPTSPTAPDRLDRPGRVEPAVRTGRQRVLRVVALLCAVAGVVVLASALLEAVPGASRDATPRTDGELSELSGQGHGGGERLRSVHEGAAEDGVGENEALDEGEEAVARLEGGVAGAFDPLPFEADAGGRIEPDPEWVDEHVVTAEVPLLDAPVRCHRKLVPPLEGALGELEERGLGHLIDPDQYGGCWVPRHILHEPDRALSLHAWGLAIDLNVEDNPYGREPEMDQRVVDTFTRWGFAWGGHWRTPDGMHFELRELREEPAERDAQLPDGRVRARLERPAPA